MGLGLGLPHLILLAETRLGNPTNNGAGAGAGAATFVG